MLQVLCGRLAASISVMVWADPMANIDRYRALLTSWGCWCPTCPSAVSGNGVGRELRARFEPQVRRSLQHPTAKSHPGSPGSAGRLTKGIEQV